MYSIIIPIYNEKKAIIALLENLKTIKPKIEVIIIDDGSTDGTNLLLNNAKDILLIKNKNNIGKGASIVKGLEIAKGENIILVDGDLEVQLNDTNKLIKTFEEDSEIGAVVGIRWKNSINYSFKILDLGNYILNSLFNLIYNSKMNDILCCFKVLPKSTLESLNLKSNRFSIETEIMSKLILNKINIKEVEINYTRRSIKDGKKIKFSDSFDIILTMLKIRFLN